MIKIGNPSRFLEFFYSKHTAHNEAIVSENQK